MKPMIQAHLVERDQFGFWTHPNYPDLADNCSSSEAQETLRRLGLELQNVFMESDAPRLYDSARSDQRYSEWLPTRPEGAGWFVLSIHDTDNGPVCQYVRPLGEHLSPIDLDAAAEQHERLLSEACAKALNQRDAALARVASLESKLEELEKLEPAAPSDPKLKPCPLCGSTNIRMLKPELLDTNAWNCAIECLDCQVYIGPSYCEPDTVTARYSAQVDWNRRPSAKSHADEREQFLMANLLVALEVALGDVTALAIVDRVRQVADRIYPTSSLSPVPQAEIERLGRSATERGSTCCKGGA
ncbi:Lar family restriction alleviation protein [Pseudomonas aeruginosa]|uniref:Lar family restriction alleviation protein n=1 Tax=Pseudomonas aeruginosa TaxID=287 RepID=UPI001F4A0F95|nr:Lar family restriction alleviation protein [Pseudomonas aeruginosa]